MKRIRWETDSAPLEGMVLDNFPRPGYSVVESLEDDPEAVWEIRRWGSEIPEFRPKTIIVTLRPATEDEVAKEQAWYQADPPKAPSMLERLFR